MIDSHTHLYFPEFGEDIDNIISKSLAAGIKHFILPNVDEESITFMKGFHKRYPEITSMAMGLHPTEVKHNWREIIHQMEEEFDSGLYKAVGEVGIDLYWDKSLIDLQLEAFEAQLKIADNLKLPVIIHSRSAFEETMQVIEKTKPSVPLIFHSFTGNVQDVKRIRNGCDPYFGINGVVTYKNAQSLRDSLEMIGLNKILLETDSPYLTPVPFRGKRNDSSYLSYIRDKVADTLGLPSDVVDTVTDWNAIEVFKL